MTTVRDPQSPGVGAAGRALGPLPSDLPPVERRAAIPAGFLAGGGIAGIKASGRPDLALIVRSGAASLAAAAVFTPNRFAAAPIRRSRLNLLATEPAGNGGFGYADAVVCTSGSANAATGPAGDEDQAEVGRIVNAATGTSEERVLHLSTGVIGTRLPLDLIRPAVAALVPALASNDEGLLAAAEAFRTTDSVVKVATATVDLPGGPIRVTGIAKGVGMIHPTMSTMLSVLVTDAAAEPRLLWEVLRAAAARTWNQLSVDGDTSTNDTVFLLASGAAGVVVDEGSRAFAGAVEAVARDLARQQAADGEGATALVTCQVSGAVDDAEARAVARVVISSSLLKAAIHGRDPNWGRIAAAVGNADGPAGAVPIDPARLSIAIAGVAVFAGESLSFEPGALAARMDAPELVIRVDLGLGDGTGEAFGCDLTERYVLENSAYST